MKPRQLTESGSQTAQMISNLLMAHQEYTQAEIASAAGFPEESSKMIMTQIKSGRTKMPIGAITPMCKFLGEDPKELLAVAAMEYNWELFEELEEAGVELKELRDLVDSGTLRTMRERNANRRVTRRRRAG